MLIIYFKQVLWWNTKSPERACRRDHVPGRVSRQVQPAPGASGRGAMPFADQRAQSPDSHLLCHSPDPGTQDMNTGLSVNYKLATAHCFPLHKMQYLKFKMPTWRWFSFQFRTLELYSSSDSPYLTAGDLSTNIQGAAFTRENDHKGDIEHFTFQSFNDCRTIQDSSHFLNILVNTEIHNTAALSSVSIV